MIIVGVSLFFASCELDPGYKYFNRYNLYYDDYSSIENYTDISNWINDRVYYKVDKIEWWSSPLETVTRGYGDCDDFSILFINIAYIVFDVKSELIAVDIDNMRTVVSGGNATHALVKIDGLYFEPQL